MYKFYNSNAFLILLILLNFYENISDPINIVNPNAYVRYCFGANITGSSLFDGNRDIPYLNGDTCDHSEVSVYSVTLIKQYFIHYVILYDGCTSDISLRQLDYFEVYNIDDVKRKVCSDYPKANTGSNRDGMRVNCRIYKYWTNTFLIESHQNNGFAISEIEAYTFANVEVKLKDPIVFFYRGCYADILAAESKLIYTPFILSTHDCRINEKTYISFKNNETFYCHDDFNDQLPDSECDIKCPNPEYSCGSGKYFSVYVVLVKLPIYVGCFSVSKFLKNQYLPWIKYDNLTISKCIIKCEDYLHAMLLEGMYCACGKSLNKQILDLHIGSSGSEKCNIPCPGSTEDMCGGNKFVSIYTTCQHKEFESDGHSKCSKLLRCVDEMDEYGECIGGCQPGYYGKYCIEKEVDQENSTQVITATATTTTTTTTKVTTTTTTTTSVTTTNPNICISKKPCELYLNTECLVDPQNNYTCQCKKGYRSFWEKKKKKKKKKQSCLDINECDFEPCDSNNSQCYNVPGDFYCDCIDSYWKLLKQDICVNVHTVTANILAIQFEKPQKITPLTLIHVFVMGVLTVCIVIFLKIMFQDKGHIMNMEHTAIEV